MFKRMFTVGVASLHAYPYMSTQIHQETRKPVIGPCVNLVLSKLSEELDVFHDTDDQGV